MGGFGRDARQPIDVNADQLDVNDASKTARFTGNVTATQGDSTLKSPELTVTYEGKAAGAQLGGPPQGRRAGLTAVAAAGQNGAVITAGADRRVPSEEVDVRRQGRYRTLYGSAWWSTRAATCSTGGGCSSTARPARAAWNSPAEAAQAPGRITATFYQTEAKARRPSPRRPAPTRPRAVQEQLFGSFKTDPNAPIDIEADSLDVNRPRCDRPSSTPTCGPSRVILSCARSSSSAFYSRPERTRLGGGAASDKTDKTHGRSCSASRPSRRC